MGLACHDALGAPQRTIYKATGRGRKQPLAGAKQTTMGLLATMPRAHCLLLTLFASKALYVGTQLAAEVGADDEVEVAGPAATRWKPTCYRAWGGRRR